MSKQINTLKKEIKNTYSRLRVLLQQEGYLCVRCWPEHSSTPCEYCQGDRRNNCPTHWRPESQVYTQLWWQHPSKGTIRDR